MKINLSSIFVTDQEKALKFYTEKLGFVKKNEVPLGDFKWLTLVSPDSPEGTELLLEPNNNPVALAYQQGIFGQNIPAASFGVENIEMEYKKLKERDVKFKITPTNINGVSIAVFDDTCGNLIQILEQNK